jgi:DNA-binding MarR family transcriptional regulator
MSNRALRWARQSRGLTPTQKLVLLILADSYNDSEGACWSAAKSISEETGLSDRAVRTALHDLIAAGAIEGTMRSGVRPRWVLAVQESGTTFLPKRNGLPVPKRNHVPSNRKQVPSKAETQSVKPEPVSDEPNRTLTEPNRTQGARQRLPAVVVPLPPWLPEAAWHDWCQHRRGKTWTQRAAELSIQELAKLRDAGNEPQAVIEQSIASGWRGLFPLKHRAPKREQLHDTIADIMRDPLGCGGAPPPGFDFEGEADHG